MSPYFPRRDLEANWCFLAGNMPSLWWFCRFSPCQLWAIDSLCWGRSLLSFSCLGVRMSHQSRSSCFSPGPLSSWSVVPSLYFVSFLVLLFSFPQTFITSVWNLHYAFCASRFLLCFSSLSVLWAISSELSYPSQHSYWVFQYVHFHLLRVCESF